MVRPSQGEALAVWALLAADVVAVFVTYSRIDPAELYSVSREGVAGGLSRTLVQLNFPVALLAIPLALLAVAVLSRRAWLVAGPALALCAVTAIPGVLDDEDLDARLVNAAPALGVALALALTIAATRTSGTRLAPRDGKDGWRIAAGVTALAVSLPWITAELGFHLPGGIFLTDETYAEPGRLPAAAVHLGHHHGFAGTLFVLCALLLSRTAPPAGALRRAYGALVSLALVYGATNLVQDLWHEQVVKLGWTAWDVPSALFPGPTLMWALMLLVAAVVYALGFARPHATAQAR
jgi:hypothetical protein